MANRLTDAHARNAKPRARPYKLPDGGGLHLLITPTGSKLWRFRYRLGTVENMFAVGEYPLLGLHQAREARDAARRLVKEGIHPAQDRATRRSVALSVRANTFDSIAHEWIDEHRLDWSSYYLNQVETILDDDVYPTIGHLPIKTVTAHQLLAIVKRVAKRGAPTVAILIRQWCSAIFRYATATLRADTDPAAALKGAITRPKVKHKHALSVKEIGLLLRRLEGAGGTEEVRTALKLLLLTFVRPGELRGARWSEFDLDAAEWCIPAERMKMREPHTVPLSSQAVELLYRLQGIGSQRPHVFPNMRDPKRIMSPTTLNRFLERIGYAGQFSAHGCRATASTVLNEMSYRPEVIERQLAHRERNSVRASYNHASYMPERRKMMQEWADFVDAQRSAPDNVIPIRATVSM
jgi:integrase